MRKQGFFRKWECKKIKTVKPLNLCFFRHATISKTLLRSSGHRMNLFVPFYYILAGTTRRCPAIRKNAYPESRLIGRFAIVK